MGTEYLEDLFEYDTKTTTCPPWIQTIYNIFRNLLSLSLLTLVLSLARHGRPGVGNVG